MKRGRIEINVLFLIVIFFTCCIAANNPKDVAEHFIKASVNMDFKEAKRYATPETAKMLDLVEGIVGKTRISDSTIKKMKIEIGEETIKGDNATIKYKKDDSNKEYVINLKRINGKWLVAISMDDLNSESDLQAGEKETSPDSVIAK